jgi:nitrite reductase/ring-hydroxylating ferredoxin subunit
MTATQSHRTDTAADATDGSGVTAQVSTPAPDGLVRACSLSDLQRAGVLTMGGSGHNVALFWHEGRVHAVDNRCPHMGFPLSRGSCEGGLLTCYWHYARFDLASGGSFDPGLADDLSTYPIVVHDGDVYVGVDQVDTPEKRAEARTRALKLLDDGMEQLRPLFLAKATLRLLDLGVPPGEIAARAAEYSLRFGSRRNSSGWGDGTTILTAMAHVAADVAPEDRALALYHGTRRAAEDVANQVERTELDPLPVGANGAGETGGVAGFNGDAHPVTLERLREWFRHFIEIRQADGAERALRTAIDRGASPAQLIDLLAAAATDHYYRDFSHVMDTIAKQAELLDLVGWDRAAFVLPSIGGQLAASTREEERNSWHHPIDLVAIVEPAVARLAGLVRPDAPPTGAWEASLAEAMLGDDPREVVGAVMAAFEHGMAVADAAQALAYAAALRFVRFPTSNEFGDWDTVLHDFTYCASLAQVAKRAPSVELARGVLHGAMVVYLSRFLNLPAARLPGARALDAEPRDAAALTEKLLALYDQQARVEEAATVVYRYLTLGHDPGKLRAAMARGTLREDAGFHDYQILEEGFRLARDLEDSGHAEEARHVLVGVARWQAAHSPTRRAVTQTHTIALRLHRGEAIYEESGEPG